MAGDLTKAGLEEEAEVLAHELEGAGVPVIAVLGNHDLHSDQADRVRGCLEHAGVVMLEGETHVVRVSGVSLGIAGIRGFGGGFAGASATEFGEPEMKRFVRVTVDAASALRSCLEEGLATDVRVALLHYSPVRDTLHGEPPEIYPFLGSYLLAEAVDTAGCDLVLHGHAHRGTEWGIAPGASCAERRPAGDPPRFRCVLARGQHPPGAVQDRISEPETRCGVEAWTSVSGVTTGVTKGRRV